MNYPNWYLAIDILCAVTALCVGIFFKNVWAIACMMWIIHSILLKLRMRN